MKPDKLENILEFYRPRPIRTSKRTLYPRGFTLSSEFLDSFHLEFDRMVHEGCDPKKLVNHFSKALRFHTDDERSQAVMEAKKGWQKKDWPPARQFAKNKEKVTRRREGKEAAQEPVQNTKKLDELAQSCGTDKKGKRVCRASHSRGGPAAGTKVDSAGRPIKEEGQSDEGAAREMENMHQREQNPFPNPPRKKRKGLPPLPPEANASKEQQDNVAKGVVKPYVKIKRR